MKAFLILAFALATLAGAYSYPSLHPNSYASHYEHGQALFQGKASLSFDGEMCVDGTYDGQCSENKPQRCFSGILVDDCQACGCLQGACSEDGSCYSSETSTSPSPQPTDLEPTPSPTAQETGATPEPSVLPTPTPQDTPQATPEGQAGNKILEESPNSELKIPPDASDEERKAVLNYNNALNWAGFIKSLMGEGGETQILLAAKEALQQGDYAKSTGLSSQAENAARNRITSNIGLPLLVLFIFTVVLYVLMRIVDGLGNNEGPKQPNSL